MRALIIFIFLLVLFCNCNVATATATATETETETETDASKPVEIRWQVFEVSEPSDAGPQICGIGWEFDGGTGIYFSGMEHRLTHISLSTLENLFVDKQIYIVNYSINGNIKGKFQARASGKSTLIGMKAGDNNFANVLKDNLVFELKVEGGNSFKFDLAGIQAAIKLFNDCTDDSNYIDRAIVDAQPPSSQGTMLQPKSAKKDEIQNEMDFVMSEGRAALPPNFNDLKPESSQINEKMGTDFAAVPIPRVKPSIRPAIRKRYIETLARELEGDLPNKKENTSKNIASKPRISKQALKQGFLGPKDVVISVENE